MPRTRTVDVEVEVEVDLESFSTQDLIDELDMRNEGAGSEIKTVLSDIYHKRRMGRDYQTDLDQLIWQVIGRM